MQIIQKQITEIKPYDNNPRFNDAAVDIVAKSIQEFGFRVPIVIDSDGIIVTGHTRHKAALTLGLQIVPCVIANDLDDDQIKAFRLVDNKTSEYAKWDIEKLDQEIRELQALEFDIEAFDFKLTGLDEEQEEDDFDPDAALESIKEPKSQPGTVWILGDHRLMCGDSTSPLDIDRLMKGYKTALVFTDPPYGMNKENDGVLNDNQNLDDLLDFNRQWIFLAFEALEDNGSFYCWGIDQPLMDIYGEIIRPMIADHRATFRNLITWDKGHGQGQTSAGFRMYAPADEKCLFVVKGVQGFNSNLDNYFEGWEPIRDYLLNSRLAMGWDVPKMKTIVGHSDLSRDHWTSKSQFNFPTKKVYEALQHGAKEERQANGLDNDAFDRSYADLKTEYESIKKEFDGSKAYFDNTHDNMNSVWSFQRTSAAEREHTGGHATPKPLALCARGIKSSARKGSIVLDLFGGSGSTLIASEETGRICYMMELDPKWCDVIVARWEALTKQKAVMA